MLWPAILSAQDDQLARRHARIESLYSSEKYAEVIREIDLQIKQCEGTPWADSLHKYLYKYGRAHRKVKDASAGTEAAERIMTLVRKRGNAAHELEALFDLSWSYYDVGELKQCARVDSLAVITADRDPKIPISQKGRARQYLAFDYGIIGDHRRAADLALEALQVYGRADSIAPVQWAESYTAVGSSYWHLGRIREAEEYYLKALRILGEGSEEAILARRVSTNGNLGVLWQNSGDLQRARNYYQESLRCSETLIAATKDPFVKDEAIVHRSRTYLNLATIYTQLGDDGRARELLQMAWNDRSAVLQPDDPQLHTVKDRMADLEMSNGSLDKARELVTAHASACERSFGRQSEEYIRACSKLGEIHHRRGDPAKADSLFNLSIGAALSGSDQATNVVLAQTYVRRSKLLLKEKRYTDAIADLQKARMVMRNIYDSMHYKVAGIDVLMAEAAYSSGDHSSAHDHASSALKILRDRLEHLRSNSQPKAFPDPHLLPDAIYWKLRSARSLNDRQKLSTWKEDLELAMDALSRNKAAIQDDASKLLLVGTHEQLFDLALDLAYDAYERSRSEADAERFFQWSERDRSTLLKARLNTFAGLAFSGVPDSIITREQELIASLRVDDEDRGSATELQVREREYAEFLSGLEKQFPAYFELRYGEPDAAMDEVRKALLTRDRQLLSYALTSDHLYIFMMGLEEQRILRVPAAGLNEAIKNLNAAIAQRDERSYVRAAREVYDLVIAPMADVLIAEELLIIPDGPLHTINFETLLMADPGKGGLKEQLLLNRHTIAYLLSASTALRFAQLSRDRANGALAVAPGFDDDLKERYASHVKDSTQLDRQFLRNVRQPFALRTAAGLGNTLHAMVMLRDDATEKNFRSKAEEYGIIHLGTHAELNRTAPMYSRLVLSKDSAGGQADSDGYLHAYEIYELDLRAQLAVLTACETGVGEDVNGEGVRSLGYGFAFAGCPSLVSTLWKVDEKTSSEIIERFYDHLASGMPKHKALRQAKLDHLSKADAELSLPYYWGGMVLMGDVDPIKERSNQFFVITGVLITLVLVSIWYFRRRSRQMK